MRTRRLLAAAVVAALPLFVGTLHAPLPRSTADTAPTHRLADHADGPRWLYASGMDWDAAWGLGEAFGGCGFCWSALVIAS